MPKVVTKKKIVAKQESIPPEPIVSKEEIKDSFKLKQKVSPNNDTRTVHRFFECLVHAEVAVEQLSKIGIYPGGEAGEALQQKLQDAISIAKSVVADYQVICNEIGY
jgi:hypothetical protein